MKPEPSSGEPAPTGLRRAGLILLGLLLMPLAGLYTAMRRSPWVAAMLPTAFVAAIAVSYFVLGYQRDVSSSMALAAAGDRVTALGWVDGEGGILQVGTQRGALYLVSRDGTVSRSSAGRDQGPIVTIFDVPPREGDTLHYAWLAKDDGSGLESDGHGGVGITMSAPLSFVLDRKVTIVADDPPAGEAPAGPSRRKAPDKSEAKPSPSSRPDRSPTLLARFPTMPPGAIRRDGGGPRVSAIAVLRREDGTETVVAGYDDGAIRTTNAAGDLGFPDAAGVAPPLSSSPIVAVTAGRLGTESVFVSGDADGHVAVSRVPPGVESPPPFSSEPLQWSESLKTLPARDGLVLSRDGKVLMFRGEDGSVAIARSPFRATGERPSELRRYDLGAPGRISAAVLSPRGDLFAVARDDGVIRVVVLPEAENDAPSAARNLLITGHADVITHLAISPDGRYLASSGIDGRLRITDLDRALVLSRWPLFDLATGPAIQAMQRSPIMAATHADKSAPAIPSATGDFAVLFGSDTTLESAQDEVARARDAGFTTAAIYMRKGWYASVVAFPDATSRASAMPTIQNLSNWSRDASPISLSAWCPQPRSAAGYTHCQDVGDGKASHQAN